MGEALFELLFKYRPFVYAKGHFMLAPGGWSATTALLVVAVAVPAVLTYRRVRAKTSGRDRLALAVLRGALVGVLLFCLLRPKLVLSTVVPQKNFVGILLDDSRSMQIADVDSAPRGAFAARQFAADSGPLLRALSQRFLVRTFRFSADAERVAGAADLRLAGGGTDLGKALATVSQELAGVPLAGLVVVTDGADNGNAALTDRLLALRAAKVPVFTVGVGRERFTRDIEVRRATLPQRALKGSALVVDLSVAHRGFSGARVPVYVEDEGRILGADTVTLPSEGEDATVRVHFTAAEAGTRRFRFRIPPQANEMVTQNNAQEALVRIEDRREKILYVEGEPRYELKFLRRAVETDKNLQLVTLLRTAPEKFLRLDVDSAEELRGGFPKTREELFGYRGLILGSVEASFFTPDQLRMIADFVSQRGGGLLVLGGRRALAEGGYGTTPVADVLPVLLERATDTAEAFLAEVKPELTPVGMSYAVTQLAPTEQASAARWRTLPPLTTVNPIRRVRPGASILLNGMGVGSRDRYVMLAVQRYGRGKTIALPVQDTWLWQMHADIPLEDQTHETFWQQMLRWLVADVPQRVRGSAGQDQVAVGTSVMLRAEIDDDRFVRVNDGVVTARVINEDAPGGAGPGAGPEPLPMEWTVDRDGEYRTTFTADRPGLYRVAIDAKRGAQALGSDTVVVRAGDLPVEYFGAEMRAPLLRRIAEETGGRFYTPATAGTLPEDISYSESGATVREERDLWDLPIVFLVLVALMGAEWGYRRARGLA